MTNMKFEIAMILFSFLILSCEQEDGSLRSSGDGILDETSFIENALASVADDVDDAVDNSSAGGFGPGLGFGPRRFLAGGGFGFLNCATVEESEQGVYPLILSIDYGDGCESFHGLTKSGKIIITVTGDLAVAGSQRISTFEDFAVNGNQIEGTRTFSNGGIGSVTATLEGGRVTTSDGQVISRESTRTRTVIAGTDTDDRLNDIYQISGGSSGVNSEGLSYSKSIVTTLIRSRDCRWITSGVIQIQVEGEEVTTIDFGDGSCDDLAIRTQNGVSEEFTMDFRMKRFGRFR